MTRARAAIDIGTYTARLLIVSDPMPSERINPLVRKRRYIRLAEGFDASGKKIIQPESLDRTVAVIQDFLRDLRTFKVRSIHAVATGVVRDSANKSEFIEHIYEQTGIRVRLVTGEEEARLTAKGAMHSLDFQAPPFVIFDLGGGSTEFFFESKNTRIVKSVPLGAMILTTGYLKSDPPENADIDLLSRHIDGELEAFAPRIFQNGEPLSVVGTGGTVTTLAMMLNGIEPEGVSAEQVNGLVMKMQDIEALFNQMKKMRFQERLTLPGLDKGRAGIILAGAMVVMRIMYFSKVFQLTVSMSDLLEGILIDHYKGEINAR